MIVSTRVCDMPEAPIGANQARQRELDRAHAGPAELQCFGLDGASYEIDLCEPHARLLAGIGEEWAGQARRAGRTLRQPKNRTAAQKRYTIKVRAWARENGWPNLGPRGRLADEITAAYEIAQ